MFGAGGSSLASVAQSVNWIAIAGILGTLGGVLIGSFATYKIQARQLAHEDSTRFHDLRIETYAEFTKRANDVVSYYMQRAYDEQAEVDFEDTIHALRLVGSKKVVRAADAIHKIIGEMEPDGQKGRKLDDKIVAAYSEQIKAFISEARNELQTE